MARSRRDSALGQIGEHHARLTLEARGYAFIARNWNCAAGELDLVMLDGEELVFVEVKTRRGEQAGRADDAISASKAQRMLGAAEWFLAEHPAHQERVWRCDLMAITVDPRSGVATGRHYINAIVSG